MPSTVSSYPETHIWSAPSALQKLHSRAREAETACCAGVTVTKSLSCIEIPQCIYDSRVGLGLFSQDPIGFAAGDANLYRYVGNSPTNFRDPTGLWQDPPEREKGHRKGSNPEKHSQAEHARRLQQQNAIRRLAQESRNDVVNDALKHIDDSISELEDARKTVERKMLNATTDSGKHAEDMKKLTQSIESLKEIELIVDKSEIVDVKNLEDLTDEAKEKLTKKGRWVIGRKVFGAIPMVGALGIVAAQSDNVEAKGHYFGTLQTGLEQVPIVEWVVLAGGDQLIPSDKDAARWYEVISNPGKTIHQIEQARGFMGWIDDLLKPFDYLCGNWW